MCSHFSIDESRQSVRPVNGKKLRSRLIVMTDFMTRALAKRSGAADVIEKVGGFILTEY